MVVFWCLQVCVTISNPDLLSSSETEVNLGIKSWKNHPSEWSQCQKAVGGIYFTKKWRAETLQPGLEFDYFKPRLENGIFKRISWLNGSSFGAWSGYSEGGSQNLPNGTNAASQLAITFLCSIPYSNGIKNIFSLNHVKWVTTTYQILRTLSITGAPLPSG